MILQKKRYLNLLVILIISFSSYLNPLYSQDKGKPANHLFMFRSLKQDTAHEMRKTQKVRAEEPDTNFTFEKYAAFLKSISDTSKYIVLPIDEFRKTIDNKKIIVGLRHDLDNDLNHGFVFSDTEFKLGIRSTYYILHTAPYYLENPSNMAVHTEKIIPILKTMQNERHFEIGLHNDLVTLQAVYHIDPVQFLHNELNWLRSNGIVVHGSASHGSPYCYTYKYLNFYFFEECTYPVVGQFVNNVTLPIGASMAPMKKGKMSDFNLDYEAYFLDNNKYFSDATVTAGVRWNIGMLDVSKLKAGDRVIVLLHPIHWHEASVNADIEAFNIKGEKSSEIDRSNKKILVKMPYGTDRNSLSASFVLSPGSQAKLAGKLQISGLTLNNMSQPLTYRIYAENREVYSDWTINVVNAKNNACDLVSFIVPGFFGDIKIDAEKKTLLAELNGTPDLSQLRVGFELSPGARAYIGESEQLSPSEYLDFRKTLILKIVAEDSVTKSEWAVTIIRKTVGIEDIETSDKGISVYPNPSSGIITMHFNEITISPVTIEIFNNLGKKIYTAIVNKTGSFIVTADLTNFPPGVYFVKHSGSSLLSKILITKDFRKL